MMTAPSSDTRPVLADVYDLLLSIAERESRHDESTDNNHHEEKQTEQSDA
jgi:hypothetical protein